MSQGRKQQGKSKTGLAGKPGLSQPSQRHEFPDGFWTPDGVWIIRHKGNSTHFTRDEAREAVEAALKLRRA
jgi:hypothetical protein